MFLTKKYAHISPFPNPNPNHNPNKRFDETLILKRLTSLLKSSPSISLSVLSAAVDLLSSSLTSLSNLLSDPSLSRSEPDIAALASYLDSSLSLLDAVNSLSALIAALSRRRLHLSFALHLLRSRTELTRKARDSLAEWSDVTTPAKGAADLIVREPPRGMASAVQRAICDAEAVSAVVIGMVFSFLGEKSDLGSIGVPSEVNGVLTAVGGKKGSLAAEIEAVGSSVTELRAAGGDVERLRDLTEEAEKRTEELTAGLDRLDNAVNGVFRVALCARNAALQGFRFGGKKCK